MGVVISLKGKNALVSGAGRGIGAEIAKRLAEAGANVALVGRTMAKLKKTEQAIKEISDVKTVTLAIDLMDGERIPDMVKEAHQALGGLDILVNNAAVNYRETAYRVTMEHWDMIMNTNLKGYFLMARECASYMMEKGGSIVNIGSELSFVGVREGQVAYSVSKAAINQLTRVLAAEWAEKKIRVNTVIPGFTETELVTELLNRPGYREQYEKAVPIGRLATPEEVANAVLFIASDFAGFTTAETFLVDGGFTNIKL